MANSEEEIKIEDDKAQKEIDAFLQERIVVYAMPRTVKKNYQHSESNPKNTKILILILGIFVLLVIGGLSYYLVVKTSLFSIKQVNDSALQASIQDLAPVEIPQNTMTATTTEIATTTNDLNSRSNNASTSDSVLSSSSTLEVVSPIFSEGSVVASPDATSSSETNAAIKEGVDTDADGLGDLEEVLLGTDKTLMDSDGDGYSDFQELNTLHNPVNSGGIASNTAIAKYQNKTHRYSLLYPLSWLVSNFDGDNSVIFRIDALQFVQVTAQQNDNKQSLEDWYMGQFGVDLVGESQKITSKAGWDVITSKDGLNWFLMKEGSNDIYVISYNIGISKIFNYKKIFEMMISSLDIMN